MSKREIISLIIVIVLFAIILTIVTIIINKLLKTQNNRILNGDEDVEVIEYMHHEINEKVIKKNKIKNIIKNVVFYVFIALIIPVIAFSFYQKVNDNVAMFGNNTIMVVASGSMSFKHEANDYLVENDLNDQFQTGDIIVLTKVNDSSEINKYDVIAFENDKGINIIHRIIDIYPDGTYQTKGDANGYLEEDLYNPSFGDIIGKYEGKRIPFFGKIVMFLQSPIGFSTMICLIYCIYILDRYNNKLNKSINERIKSLQDVLDKEVEIPDCKETKIIDNYTYYFDNNKVVGRKLN